MDHRKIFTERFTQLVREKQEEAKAAGSRLTGETIARILGVSTPAVFNYISGKLWPRIDTLAVIAERFGVSTDWLLGLRDTQKAQTREIVIRKHERAEQLMRCKDCAFGAAVTGWHGEELIECCAHPDHIQHAPDWYCGDAKGAGRKRKKREASA